MLLKGNTKDIKTEAKIKLFGQILKDKGLVTEEQIQEALAVQKDKGGLLGEILIQFRYVTGEQVLQALSEHLGLEIVNLEILDIPSEVIHMVPPAIAQLYRIIPIRYEDGVLTIAQSDPLDLEFTDDLRLILKHTIKPVICSRESINRFLERYYPQKHESVQQLLLEFKEDNFRVEDTRDDYIDIEELLKMADAAAVKKWVGLMFYDAILNKASDIHFEAFEDGFKVRFRIDGILFEKISPPKQLGIPITTRIKVMAGMDIAERRLPQDGRIRLNIGGKTVDVRVSTLPTKYGESIVMRLLNKSAVSLNLEKLGFCPDDLQKVYHILKKPSGIIFVTGPTGSGKTTSLYAALNYLNTIGTKIITTEDPVEYEVDGIVQVQVNPLIGVTFASCLRAILRQDPDIILVGEIRDKETSTIATQAALTGHLVFGTLHTNDSPSSITRLIDMGIKPYLIAATVEAVISQRLVRKICTSCKTEYEPSEEILKELNIDVLEMKGKIFYHGRGCKDCNYIGYKGRMGIFEIMTITDRIRHLIIEQSKTTEIRDAARANGMKTLLESGLTAARNGLTTLQEVLRETMVT